MDQPNAAALGVRLDGGRLQEALQGQGLQVMAYRQQRLEGGREHFRMYDGRLSNCGCTFIHEEGKTVDYVNDPNCVTM